ncbi:hypothetical protein T492DRAFT_1149447 [Pavlovales sp. CCMP2436]|nr:hypothetical protein T492DRAFT_1149447 [Pavlovales sp. CCMP2436]|mmetsp:Transcript_33812/g.84261  ORF Transcript_33812/g.84261 Transcript_33812/m.84261 type:complete len:168 (+) Transcript_33812:67-570(+)
MNLLLFVAAQGFVLAQGFVPAPTALRRLSPIAIRMTATPKSSHSPKSKFKANSIDGLIEQGEACLESGCNFDETSELIQRLGMRRKELQSELEYVLVTLGKLQALTVRGPNDTLTAAEQNLVQQVVADAVRLFSPSTGNDYPMLPGDPSAAGSMGYTMDLNKSRKSL